MEKRRELYMHTNTSTLNKRMAVGTQKEMEKEGDRIRAKGIYNASTFIDEGIVPKNKTEIEEDELNNYLINGRSRN